MDYDLLEPSWSKYLKEEFNKPYMRELKSFLKKEEKSGKIIYPSKEDVFSAFKYTPYNKVKVVIIGQDPYHGDNQAHGLSFSVKPGVKIPPSLLNIFKELEGDLKIERPDNGNLVSWANQGVLLLNSVLTVESNLAASHQKKGWEKFTDKVVDILNKNKNNLVFVLWGAFAQKKGININGTKHLILKSPHPSPLSAHRGFFGSHHFSQINQYLKKKNLDPINWQLS